REQDAKPTTASAGPIAGGEKTNGAAAPAGESPAPIREANAAVPNPAATSADATTPPSLGQLAKALGGLVLLAAALPFLAGAQNILGILILGIGVWQAWKV